MDPVIEDCKVGLGWAETGTKDEGDLWELGSNTADSFFVTEGITEDEIGFLLVATSRRTRSISPE